MSAVPSVAHVPAAAEVAIASVPAVATRPVTTASDLSPRSKLSPTRTKGSGRRLVHFGVTLAEILRNGEHNDIIRFSPTGDSVWILSRSELSRQVMPEFDMRPNWESFVRQLRNYGFRYASKIRSTKFVDVYVHETFNRDNAVIPVRVDARLSVGSDWHGRALEAKRNAPGMRPTPSESSEQNSTVSTA
jgi:hypothetical protein